MSPGTDSNRSCANALSDKIVSYYVRVDGVGKKNGWVRRIKILLMDKILKKNFLERLDVQIILLTSKQYSSRWASLIANNGS